MGPAIALAQTTVSGVVRDQTGLPLPGATVQVKAAGSGALLGSAVAGAGGSWTIRAVPSGDAVLSVSLQGFKPVSRPITVRPSLDPIDVTLEVGGFTEDVAVTASRDERALAAIPSAVGVLSGPLLDRMRGVNLAETLNYVPGVVAGDVSGVDDLRISIRGAGVRAGFGSRGVVLMVDGVPVTEPDGQTPHFDGQIDLTSAERIEVVKGPSSAMYGGAALGGVVNVIMRMPSRQPSVESRAEFGSYEFAKVHNAASGPVGPFVVGGTLGFTHMDGFREHNNLRNWNGTARADWSNGRSRASFSLLGTDAVLDLPGTVNREQFDTDPSQVRSIYVTNDWGRENRLFRFGGRYERQLGGGHSIEVDSYGQTRDLFHPIFVVIDQDAARYVGHARYRLTRGAHRVSAGLDFDRQQVDDRWFVNSGGRPGFQIRSDDNTITNAGFYVQDEISAGDRATIVAGVRADRINYDLRDLILQDGDASDVRTFTRVSPKVGVTARVSDTMSIYGNVSTGFEAPTLGEVRLPAGFNETVDPQKAVSVEGGVRGQVERLSFDAALYHMRVTDEILPETIDNVTVYRNVAEAGHTGLELSARLRATPGLTIDGTYSWSRFVLEDFGAFSGNRLPGIPAHTGTLRGSYVHARGWDAAVALTWSGETFVSDANTERAPAYGVVSAQAGYEFGIARVFLRAENLGDVTYTNRVQVNDTGGFFYYPAPGRSATVGVRVRW
jgi:iron complex outermembrane receptor protein